MTSTLVSKMHSVSGQMQGFIVSVILDLQGIYVNVREDFFTPDQNYEIFYIKMDQNERQSQGFFYEF